MFNLTNVSDIAIVITAFYLRQDTLSFNAAQVEALHDVYMAEAERRGLVDAEGSWNGLNFIAHAILCEARDAMWDWYGVEQEQELDEDDYAQIPWIEEELELVEGACCELRYEVTCARRYRDFNEVVILDTERNWAAFQQALRCGGAWVGLHLDAGLWTTCGTVVMPTHGSVYYNGARFRKGFDEVTSVRIAGAC